MCVRQSTADTFAWLDDLRRFRRLFRHAYGAELDHERVETLALTALAMKPALDRDLERLQIFVAALIERHEEQGI